MIAQITLRRVADGKQVTFRDEWKDPPKFSKREAYEPHDAVWQWTEGNYGCDCNRHLFFERALGRQDTEQLWDEAICGDVLYKLIDISVDSVSYYSEEI